MVFVIFEVTIKKGCMDSYLELAAKLKEEIVRSEGFIRAERFSSLVNEGKLLSLSLWESEEAVSKWRNQTEHRMSQQQGRDSLFESYRITVTSKIRSYSNTDRSEAPEDSQMKQLFKEQCSEGK